jgi:hypothetical protein
MDFRVTNGQAMLGRFGMIMPVLSGRFVAPASFTTEYHEEKAT